MDGQLSTTKWNTAVCQSLRLWHFFIEVRAAWLHLARSYSNKYLPFLNFCRESLVQKVLLMLFCGKIGQKMETFELTKVGGHVETFSKGTG